MFVSKIILGTCRMAVEETGSSFKTNLSCASGLFDVIKPSKANM